MHSARYKRDIMSEITIALTNQLVEKKFFAIVRLNLRNDRSTLSAATRSTFAMTSSESFNSISPSFSPFSTGAETLSASFIFFCIDVVSTSLYHNVENSSFGFTRTYPLPSESSTFISAISSSFERRISYLKLLNTQSIRLQASIR